MNKFITLLLMLISSKLMAADIDAKSNQFCEKIQSCVLEEMAGSDITPDIEAMAKPMIDGMCAQLKQSIISESEAVPVDIEVELMACMDSMTALSCSALMNGEAETPACVALQKKADQYK